MRYSAALGFRALALALVARADNLYKWVDKNGVTHYTDQPPPGRAWKEIRPPPAPPAPGASAKSLEQLDREFQQRRAEREKAAGATKRPAVAPPEQQPLVSSKYSTTTRTWVDYAMRSEVLSGRIGLTVKARRGNPADVWLQVEFEVPPSGQRG